MKLLNFTCKLEYCWHSKIPWRLNHRSDEPLFLDSLKFALYRSAAADKLQQALETTKEPWPHGYEMLENIANDETCTQAKVTDLWEAQVKRTGYAKQMLQKWAATKKLTESGREIDALIMPCSPWPASSRYI